LYSLSSLAEWASSNAKGEADQLLARIVITTNVENKRQSDRLEGDNEQTEEKEEKQQKKVKKKSKEKNATLRAYVFVCKKDKD
jgi:hypothetical protein